MREEKKCYLFFFTRCEVGIENIDFKYIDAYVIMITYLLRKMGETKTVCKQFVALYQQQTDSLRKELPTNIYSQIVGTQHISNMKTLKEFISKSILMIW